MLTQRYTEPFQKTVVWCNSFHSMSKAANQNEDVDGFYSVSSCTQKQTSVFLLQKGKEEGLKSTCSPIQNQTTAVLIILRYTFSVYVHKCVVYVCVFH